MCQTACVVSGDAVFSLQRSVVSAHTKSGGFAWLGRAAVAMYQYSKRTLSKSASSPMGPSTHHSLFMDAEHASCHFVSPLSLLPFCLLHTICPCANTNSCHCFVMTCQLWLLWRLKMFWGGWQQLVVIHEEMTTSGTHCFCVVKHWDLAVFKRLHLAKGHRRLIWKWKHSLPTLSYIIPMRIFYLCAAAVPYTRQETSPYKWRIFTDQRSIYCVALSLRRLSGVKEKKTAVLCICVKSTLGR